MTSPQAHRTPLIPLALLSATVLALEVFQTRLVSYSVHVLLLYAVIGIAMLGFGAAGSLVAVRRGWTDRARAPRVLAWAALAFSAGTVVAHAVFVRLTPSLQAVDGVTLAVAAVLALPYVAAGTVITVSLATAGRDLGRAYAANLIGSGVGCFVPLWLLGPLPGDQFLALLSLLAWGTALLYVLRAGEGLRSRLGLGALAALALSLASAAAPAALFPIAPEPLPGGQLSGLYAYARDHGITIRRRYDHWNVTGRIEVFEASGVYGKPGPHPAMFYAQDSSAGSSLVRWDGRTKSQGPKDPEQLVPRMCEETVYGLGYYRPRSKVLVIGLGGGPDLQCAIYHEAREVDVVEINPDSIAAVRGPFDEWLGGIGQHPSVRFHRRDGRGFIRGHAGAGYDLIQLSGVDTKQNYASGALALAENQLYTRDAFDDYLAALSPQGAIVILRFGQVEAVRLANTAVASLRRLGAKNPHTHFAILGSGPVFGLIIARQPLEVRDLSVIGTRPQKKNHRGVDIYFYTQNGIPFDRRPVVHYLPVGHGGPQFLSFFGAVAAGREKSFHSGVFDVTPTRDDRPFFFDIVEFGSPGSWDQAHVVALRNVIVSVVLLSLLFILLPVRWAGGGAGGTEPVPVGVRLRSLGYFGAVGLAFVLVEVWMLHRFAMFLGHQTYSLSVVLSALLVSTGLGAWGGGRLLPTPARRSVVGALAAVVWLGLGALWLPWLMDHAWQSPLWVRCLVAAGFVFPCGLAMGQPFVAGLGWLDTTASPVLPWAVAINSFGSVVASVGVIPLAMALGYSASLIAGAALYVLAAALGARMAMASREPALV